MVRLSLGRIWPARLPRDLLEWPGTATPEYLATLSGELLKTYFSIRPQFVEYYLFIGRLHQLFGRLFFHILTTYE